MSFNFDLLKPSASMEVTKLAGELEKQGKKVFPLSAGDTHFAPPLVILQKLNHLPAAFSHYTNAEGIDSLRLQLANHYEGYTSEHVILVPGLKQGLYYALAAINLKKLCVLEPAWLGYEATAVLASYETVSVNTYQNNWSEELKHLEFDAIILCSPNNPDGSLLMDDDLKQIVAAAQQNKAWIITDFIYDRYIYEGKSDPLLVLNGYERLIIGNGFSKSHAMTGFRAAYLLCKDKDVLNRMIVMQQNLATCVSAISQYILTDSNESDEEISRNAEYYKRNRDLILTVFPEWEKYKPKGGFYYFVDLSMYGITDGKSFCAKLIKDRGVALVPGGAYGKGFEQYVRISFSIDTDVLMEGIRAMKTFIDENY